MVRRTNGRGGFKGGNIPKGKHYVLDRFSQSDLRTWKKMSDGLEEYNIGLFHHLEGLRQLKQEDLCHALEQADPVPLNEELWVRILDYKYSMAPLSLVGSLLQGGRFNIGRDLNPSNFPAFPALYVAEEYEIAYKEKFGFYARKGNEFDGHEFALRNPNSFSAVRLEVNVFRLFDLTDSANLDDYVKIIRKFELPNELKKLAKELGVRPPWLITTTKQLHDDLMATNWRFWPAQFEVPANSQVFGRLLVEAGFEGVIYPSAKGQGNCAAIFPQCFGGSGSSVKLADDIPPGLRHSVLDDSTYSELIN